MKFLRRTLHVQAALWLIWSLWLIVAPAWLLETALAQPPLGDHVWQQVVGVMGLVLALLMILVAQRLSDLWWWTWAFAVLEVGIATVLALHAIVGLPEDAAAWPWWALAALNAAVGAAVLLGLAAAEREQPIV